MIGKSYDGTFANGVASTGVERPDDDRPDLRDLRLVRLLADEWDPLQHPLPGLPLQLDHANVGATARRRAADNNALCASRERDERVGRRRRRPDGDINGFWQARNYNLSVANVHAAVFESHGPERRQRASESLRAMVGRASPPTTCRASSGSRRRGTSTRSTTAARVWVDTLHRWFDHWLYGLPQRDHAGAAGRTSRPARTPGRRRRAGRCRRRGRSASTCRAPTAGAKGVLGLRSGGATELAHLHRRQPQRDELPQRSRTRRRTSSCSSRRR